MQLSELVYEMSQTMDTQIIEQVLQRFAPNSQLLSFQELVGGVSAQVIAIAFVDAEGQEHQWVLRLHGERDRQRNPQIAKDEFRLYQILQSAHVSVPTPYFLDTACDILPVPYFIMGYVKGKTVFAPVDATAFLQQMARTLAEIHQVSDDVSFLPDAKSHYKNRFQTSVRQIESPIRDALQAFWDMTPINKGGLLHGDFWLGNVLWDDGKLVAVIDWEDAKRGDPLIDLANSRLEVLWAFGEEAMRQFTQDYLSAMPLLDLSQLPYWELCIAHQKPTSDFDAWAEGWVDYGRPDVTGATFRTRYQWFIEQAIEKIHW